MAADIEVRRMVLREISKRHLDTSRLDVQVFHGVVYLRGTVSGVRGHNVDPSRDGDYPPHFAPASRRARCGD